MLYRYTAINPKGETIAGEREATDEKILSKVLRDEGLLITSAGAGRSVFSRLMSLGSISLGGASLFDRMIFARNIAVMIGAGLPMTRALEAQEEQARNKTFKSIIRRLKEGIVSGQTFSQSLEPFRSTFGDFFIHMMEAGEISGKLEQSLKLLSRQMKRDHDLRAKVRGAMIYPAIVISVLIIIGVLMLIYVVPTLTQTFKELQIKLPPLTLFIIAVSDFLQKYIIWVLVALAVLGYLAYQGVRSSWGGEFISRVGLRLPIFGPLIKKLNTARMARTLASLISAGLSITKSLEITGRVLGNVEYQESLAGAVASIEKGQSFSEILRQYPRLYPPLVVQMISVGEETGTMSRMLVRIALFYEEDVSETTKNMSVIIEPLMMVVIGTIVGFFAISMIQPLYSSLAGGI